jgi:hypothetical protein
MNAASKKLELEKAGSQAWYVYSAPRSLNIHDKALAYVPYCR